MSRAIARVGDRTYGICDCHKDPITTYGRIITGSPSFSLNEKDVARLGDRILADCGHEAIIVTASNKQFVDGLGVAMVDDRGEGCYNCVIIEGSPDAFTT